MLLILTFLLAAQDDAAAQADQALAQFRTAYKNPDVKARVEAVAELGKVQHAKVARVLAGLLTTDDPAVRRKAAEMLGQWTSKPAEVGAVLQAALKPNQKETAVVVALLDALGGVRDKSALDEVNQRLTHLSDEISVAAIRAAGKLGCAKSMDRLLGVWNTIHDYNNPRPAAGGVSATGQNRTPEKDRRYGAQEPELRTAVAGITGKTFGNVIEARDGWNANRATFREK
jgi:HEAT repeat protein